MTAPLSTRDAVALVTRREIVERLRDRSFYVSTGVTLALVLAVVFLPRVLGFGEDRYTLAYAGPQADAVAQDVRDRADAFGVEVTRARPTPPGPALAAGDVDAVVSGVTAGSVRVTEELPDGLGAVLESVHRERATAAAVAESGLDPERVAEVLDVAPLDVTATDPPEEGAGDREAVAFISMMILYTQMLGYGFWVALGVVEEKSSRVVELLLSAIPARALLGGKILGIGLLGLGQLLGLAVVGLGAAFATGALEVSASMVGPVATVLVWFVLGFAFYASLLTAAAARVSRQEEVQNVTTPATMVVLVSFFAAIYALWEPRNTVVEVLSFVPPFSALVAPVRTVTGDLSWLGAGVAAAVMVVAILLVVALAGRVYEGAVLRTGAKVSWREAWRGTAPASGGGGRPDGASRAAGADAPDAGEHAEAAVADDARRSVTRR